jgi:hypothetical protein
MWVDILVYFPFILVAQWGVNCKKITTRCLLMGTVMNCSEANNTLKGTTKQYNINEKRVVL